MAEGYIRSGSDMKFLILYVLDVIGEPISNEILLQAVQSDPLADYFNYASSLRELRDIRSPQRENGISTLWEESCPSRSGATRRTRRPARSQARGATR